MLQSDTAQFSLTSTFLNYKPYFQIQIDKICFMYTNITTDRKHFLASLFLHYLHQYLQLPGLFHQDIWFLLLHFHPQFPALSLYHFCLSCMLNLVYWLHHLWQFQHVLDLLKKISNNSHKRLYYKLPYQMPNVYSTCKSQLLQKKTNPMNFYWEEHFYFEKLFQVRVNEFLSKG